MATWSSFEKDKLITEGFRDFFKKKEKSVGTYPASELTTIVNLISNLAKKLNIDVDTSKIVDEFEAILKAANYNLQEQEDKIMIGGDVNLDLTKAPTLKAFMDAVAAQNPEGLKILLKALKRGAFDVSRYQPAASTEQTPTEEPEQATPATVETDFPIKITVDEFSKFIDKSNFETIKKIFNKLGVNKETEEIKQKFKSLLPPFFKSFDKALEDSDVGEYFRLQTQVKETINIKDRLGDFSNPQSNLYIFLFGALLKNYIQKRSNEVDAIVGDLPDGILKQLQNSVSGLTDKTLNSILGSKRDTDKPTAEPPSTSDEEEEDETGQIEPASSTEPAEPEVNQEPAPEPQATEEPLKIITKILGEKGVSEEKVNAFIDDLKSMGVIREIASRTLKNSLKMSKAEWEQFSKKHEEVIKAINQLGGKSKPATALRKQFKDALSKIITRTSIPRPKRSSEKKKSADRPTSKSEPTPAAATPAETEPEAAPPEPEVSREPEQAEERTFKSLGSDRQLQRLKSGNPDQFNSGRQGKMARFKTRTSDNTRIFAISKSKRDKYDENDSKDIDMAYDTWNSTYDQMTKIYRRTLKDEVKAYLLGLEGWIKEAEQKSSTKLEESLIVRWKTIAGIK